MSVRIPFPAGSEALPFFSITTPLDGVVYTLQFRWNSRAGAYWMTLLNDVGDTVILGDVRVITILPMWFNRGANAGPPGALIFFDTSGRTLPPDFGELGGRVVLLYFSADELGLA